MSKIDEMCAHRGRGDQAGAGGRRSAGQVVEHALERTHGLASLVATAAMVVVEGVATHARNAIWTAFRQSAVGAAGLSRTL